jgi:maltose O-acetyltransferase
VKIFNLLRDFVRIWKEFLWRCFNSIQSSGFVHHDIRLFLLRLVGCSLDPSVVIYENNYIGSTNIVFGRNVFLNVGGFLDACAKIELHDGVRLGPYVRILTGTHKYQNSIYRRNVTDELVRLPVTIERGCWIGMGAMILPEVTVREGCIIGAGAVVTHDTEPNGMYLGNPATRIKDLPVE